MDFKTKEETITIRDAVLTITSVVNFDELYDQLIAEGLESGEVADERIPYWSELWPSAIALAEYILDHPHLLLGKSVIEIGCGLGLPAMIAGKLGAKVTATDFLPEALNFAKLNAEKNDIHRIAYHTLDWRNPSADSHYEVLLASDVAYDRSQFQHLFRSFEQLCPQGTILLSEPNRYIAAPFIHELQERGYRYISSQHTIHYPVPNIGVTVYQLSKAD